MDSEQIKKDSNSEVLVTINGPFHDVGKAPSEQVTDMRKLKGQVVTPECPADPWEQDSSAIEHKLFSDINALPAVAISNRSELRKKMAEIYKQAHELMTCYNQRIQNLLLDDRFLHRHASEVSALMIRGLMPPLENVKSLEKTLASTRKKSEDEPVDQLQQSAVDELAELEQVFKEAKSRLSKYTKPLKPAQILQKQLSQRLERAASELQQAQKPGVSLPLHNASDIATTKPASTAPLPYYQTQQNQQQKKCSIDDLQSTQLKALALTLDTASQEIEKRNIQSFIRYVASEYQHYAPLSPFLSAAGQKSELMSMNPDKACKACQEAIVLLEEVSSGEPELSLDLLLKIDRSVGQLASFDKKLPGEVWQLMTELAPDPHDSRYHLLNLLCRKLLSDGPTPLTQKAVLNKFKEVGQLLSQPREEADFDQQFFSVFGPIFTLPGHLKKTLTLVNKPHETLALLQMFAREKAGEQARLAEMTEAFRVIGDEQKLACLIPGGVAIDCLITTIPAQLTAEINGYRPGEDNRAHQQLTDSVLAKFSDYHKTTGLIRKQTENINSQGINSQSEHSRTFFQLSKQMAETLACPDNRQEALLKNMDAELHKITTCSQVNAQAKQSIAQCRTHIKDALGEKPLANDQASKIITLFLEAQTDIDEPGAAQTGIVAMPQALVQAMASLENGASAKWYNQLFTGHLQEQRTKTQGIVKNVLDACQQTRAATMAVGSFIEVFALEITKDNDDPLIKQLGTEMQAYANRLKTV
ncbi:hypothetical protein [Endozoicomonas sp. ONNA2]|uniref:hypothetical protein n=1 Tax=Endozoicomonas sp. ONNA2 TaxID=2828741 RepID=UPI00214862EA|nr:hypothetical protein [Endozoicomonas sp. ONNA2]